MMKTEELIEFIIKTYIDTHPDEMQEFLAYKKMRKIDAADSDTMNTTDKNSKGRHLGSFPSEALLRQITKADPDLFTKGKCCTEQNMCVHIRKSRAFFKKYPIFSLVSRQKI